MPRNIAMAIATHDKFKTWSNIHDYKCITREIAKVIPIKTLYSCHYFL